MTLQNEQQASDLQGHAPGCPCNNADERGCFLISAETGKCVSCTCDRPAESAPGRQHLPECPRIEYIVSRHGYTLTAGSNGCICNRLRACEQRVRMEDDDYAYVSAQAEADGRRRGWSEALDAARERIMRLPYEIDEEILVDRDEVIGWIDALRDQPADQTGYKPPDAP